MSWLSRITQSLKEKLVSKPRDLIFRTYFNRLFERYGEILDLQIDASEKKIHLTVFPEGEEKPIVVDAKYTLEEVDKSLNLTITNATTDRKWLTLLADDFLPYTFENVSALANAVL
jgi:hypothetical protein